MSDVPAAKPVTIPVADPILAVTPVVVLLQVPPAGVPFNVIVAPTQTDDGIAAIDAAGLTVTAIVRKQLVGNLYVIKAVPAV
jgi:hypothetical protein